MANDPEFHLTVQIDITIKIEGLTLSKILFIFCINCVNLNVLFLFCFNYHKIEVLFERYLIKHDEIRMKGNFLCLFSFCV